MKRVLVAVLVALLLGIPALPAAAQGMEVEGWHLIESLYMVDSVDLDVYGGPIKSWLMGAADGLLLDYYQDSGSEGDILLTHYRTDKGGGVLASTKWEVLWDAPPSYLPAEQSVTITLEHRVLEVNSWEPPRMTAAFDVPDMEIGFTSSSPNRLHKPGTRQNPYKDETTEVYGEVAVLTTERPIAAGKESDRIALYINFGEGYGMRYTYRWGMGYVAGENGGEDESGLGTKNTAAPGSGQIFAPPTAFETPGTQDIAVLWTNMNIYAVQNGAQDYYVIFALEDDSVVTEILTYHYLSSGAQPGDLTLYAETGEEWGPFQAVGIDGQGGVENANWVADTGELALPAGLYAIADSDPSTWSCNAESDYWGMAEVRGYVRKTRGNPFPADAPNG